VNGRIIWTAICRATLPTTQLLVEEVEEGPEACFRLEAASQAGFSLRWPRKGEGKQVQPKRSQPLRPCAGLAGLRNDGARQQQHEGDRLHPDDEQYDLQDAHAMTYPQRFRDD
jgi:hypothetical protein